jgi:molecular chaperone DnaK (HSP70)
VPTHGFDFGTSTTMVANGVDVVPIASDGRGRWMPSLVGHDDSGELVVGEAAERLEFPIRSIKRAITANKQTVRADLDLRGKDERADSLMVTLLAEAVRRAAEAGAPVRTRGAVRVGCPAAWDGNQRSRLVRIARRAGLPITLDALVDEPVAAGIAWLAGDTSARPDRFRVVVFDMGGGTLDTAVLDVRGHRDVTVLAAYGIPEAGDALDEAIAEDLESILDVRVDALDSPESARAELRMAARGVKLELSTEDETPVTFSRLHFESAEIWYTRDQLEAAFQRQMDDAVMAVGLALRLAKLAERSPGSLRDVAYASIDDLVKEVDVVVLAGGMAHVAYVRTRMEAMFGPRTEVVHAYPAADDRSLVRSPELAIAVGLAQADHFGRINVFRPALGILLECDGRAEPYSLYEAFTPLMDQGKLRSGSKEIRHVRNGRDLRLPSTGSGRIRVVSYNGSPASAALDGRSLDGFPVAIDAQKFEFSIYPYGRIRLVDAAGTHEGQLDDWHVI